MHKLPLKRAVLALAGAAGLVLTTGCATAPGNADYSSRELMQRQSEEAGTILATRAVRIQGEPSGVGAVIGASVGGGVGSGIGQGTGARINGGLGGLAGAILGGMVEDRLGKRDATELSVRLSSGKVISVAVPGKLAFDIGTPVRVLSGNGYTRVVPVLPEPALAFSAGPPGLTD